VTAVNVKDFPLDPATAGELRRLVSEVLAEVLPGFFHDRGGSTSNSAVNPPRSWISGLAAGGIPSGVPSGLPSSTPMRHRGGSSTVDDTPVLSRDGTPGARIGAEADGPRSARLGVSGATAGSPSPEGRSADRPSSDFFLVRVQTDAELHEFALRVLRLADNAKLRRDLIAGRIRFRLAGEPAAGPASAVHRVDKGAVTERAVAAAAAAGARLVVGPRAVLTPLAKDKARSLGVPIEKER